jgi:glycosyltransferase involved in cell wall biosynthesis
VLHRGSLPSTSDQTELAELVKQSGLRRVHLLAWRDLADAEAGGSEVHASTISSLWAAVGVEVTMRTSFAPGQPHSEVRDGYRVVRAGSRYNVFPRAIAAELAGRHGKRDALVEIWNGVPWLSPVWARGPRVVWMHHIHGAMWKMALPGPVAPFGDLMERRLAPPFYRRTRVITLSSSSKEEMVEKLGWRAKNIGVISPGVDPKFRPRDPKSPTPLVVAVGRLMPAKHFDDIIRLLAPLRERLPGLEVVIVGEGDERPKLESEIRRLGAFDFVRLAGRISDDELISLYQRAWLLTAASEAEGWGMTITEAAACGTPAVVTDIGGHRDAVEAGVSGELVPLTDLGVAIEAVLTDTDRLSDLRRGALARAERLTWEATALATYRELADDAVRRRVRS